MLSPSAYRIDKEAEVKVSFLFLAQPNSSNACLLKQG
jgi:hypothetical protein